jgi:hypothetical protein
MSDSVNMSVLLASPIDQFSSVVEHLCESGWKLEHDRLSGFLIDYDDSFSWVYQRGNAKQLNTRDLDYALGQGATVGVAMWQTITPHVPVTLTYSAKNHFTFWLDEPRVRNIQLENVTDVTWYLSLLIVPLLKKVGKQNVTNIVWNEAFG